MQKKNVLQVRVDDAFLKMLEYLKRINGYKSNSDTIRKIIEKEYRKEHTEYNCSKCIHDGRICDYCHNGSEYTEQSCDTCKYMYFEDGEMGCKKCGSLDFSKFYTCEKYERK